MCIYIYIWIENLKCVGTGGWKQPLFSPGIARVKENMTHFSPEDFLSGAYQQQRFFSCFCTGEVILFPSMN